MPYFEDYFFFVPTKKPNIVFVHAFNDHFPANLEVIEKQIQLLTESVAEYEYDEYTNRMDLYQKVRTHLKGLQP